MLREYKGEETDARAWDGVWDMRDPVEQVRSAKESPLLDIFCRFFPRNEWILEGGCGNGQWVKVLSDEGYRIVGMDNADKTMRKLKRLLPYLSLMIGDLRYQSYKNDSFGGHISRGVIEHFEEGPEEVLREVGRTLRGGGILIITTPYFNIIKRMRYFIGKTKGKGRFYQYHYTRKELKSFFSNGYSLLKVFYLNPYKTLEDEMPIRRLYREIAKFFNRHANNLRKSSNGTASSKHKAKNTLYRRIALRLGRNYLLARVFGHSIGLVLRKRDPIIPRNGISRQIYSFP